MKFLHFADCHLDGFRDYKLAKLGYLHFTRVVQAALDENVDFVLLAGDLFNTAIPRMDALKIATTELKRLQEANIPVYAIAGSHDFSPHGKSVLDVLELAGLLTLVMKGEVKDGKLQLEFTKDEKTGALISGIIGKRGMLDSAYYKDLDTSKLQGDGMKIFLFHTALEELKTKEHKDMPAFSATMLPSGFDYYAGGHVHVVQRFSDKNYSNIVYPGPTFPNNFRELELLKKGSYILYDDSQEEAIQHKFIETKKVQAYTLDVEGKPAHEVKEYILQQVDDVTDAIVLLRIAGTLSEGTRGECELDEVNRELLGKGAFHVLQNTAKLQSVQLEDTATSEAGDVESVEQETIEEHLDQIAFPLENEKEMIQTLLSGMQLEQIDGETKTVFHSRVVQAGKDILEQ